MFRTSFFKTIVAAVFLAALIAAGALWAFDFKNPNAGRKKFKSGGRPVAVAGVRGVDEPGDPGDVDARDEAAVSWLEAQAVSDADLKDFLSRGGLGPLP